jgi:hypothetical protein
MDAKRCPGCGILKPLSAFAVDRGKTTGLKSRCKVCDSGKSQRYYEANRERRLRKAAEARAAKPQNVRQCKSCGKPASTSRHWYCDGCAEVALAQRVTRRHRGPVSAQASTRLKERERQRSKLRPSSARGYGWKHQQQRARWQKIVDAGGVRCARCKRPIIPGQPWDLGHVDTDRSLYAGPEHRRCNRATAAHKRQVRLRRRWSRWW